jgi:YesN/AraC family two-component response regulator
VTASLRAQWILCAPNGSPAELLEQCKRLCQVIVCDSRNALTAISKAKPDIIVFEFDNPVAEHLHLLQTVKRLHPSVPILMITSTHSEDLAVWAFRARVWNYLVKPVPLRELKSNLDQLEKISKRREAVGRQIERPGTIIPPAPSEQAPGHTEKEVMQRIIENLRRDHTTRLSISQLAHECGMSRFSFSRLFRSNFGCSCREYVMRLRIETACKMLEAPHPSVTHVAITAGFTDASYFARMFRRRMRKSPIEYAQVASKQRQRDKVVSPIQERPAIEDHVVIVESRGVRGSVAALGGSRR